jgi:hypothetical protein
MKNSVYVLAVLLVFGIVGVPTIGHAFTEAPDATETVDNETVAISTSSWTEVSTAGSATSFYDNETVYYNGSVVSESEYRWSTSNGSIRAEDGGTLADASEVDITYAYDRNTEFTELGQSALTGVFWVFATLSLVVAAGVIFAAFDALGGGAGGR